MTDELAARIFDELRALREQVAALGAQAMLGPAEAAKLLGMSRSTFDRKRSRGLIPKPAIDDGRILRWRPGDLVG